MSRRKNKKYSKELKLEAVQAYLRGEGSLRQACRQYEIRDKKKLRNWILWYNGHKEFKERREAGGEIYITKGRKTTQEERGEIVACCIEHGKDYPLTLQTYGVSYQQIYAEEAIDQQSKARGLLQSHTIHTHIRRIPHGKAVPKAKCKQVCLFQMAETDTKWQVDRERADRRMDQDAV